MGIGGMRMAIDGDHLRIETSSGKQLDGPAARDELERRLGFRAAVDGAALVVVRHSRAGRG